MGGVADGERGVVYAVADDFIRERQAAGGVRAGEDRARVFPAGSVSGLRAVFHPVRGRRRQADQEDRGLSPVPRGAGIGAGDDDRREAGGRGWTDGAGGSGDVWQGGDPGIAQRGWTSSH